MEHCAVNGIDFGFFFNDTATTEIYTLSLHDALPILSLEEILTIAKQKAIKNITLTGGEPLLQKDMLRSEEHTSELQSRQYLVCRLLLEKKKPFRMTFAIYIGSHHVSTSVTPLLRLPP